MTASENSNQNSKRNKHSNSHNTRMSTAKDINKILLTMGAFLSIKRFGLANGTAFSGISGREDNLTRGAYHLAKKSGNFG